jgi:hypothetical protein
MPDRCADTGTPGQRTQQPCPKGHSPQAYAAATLLSVRHRLHASRQQPPLQPHPGRADRLSREPSAKGVVGPVGRLSAAYQRQPPVRASELARLVAHPPLGEEVPLEMGPLRKGPRKLVQERERERQRLHLLASARVAEAALRQVLRGFEGGPRQSRPQGLVRLRQ